MKYAQVKQLTKLGHEELVVTNQPVDDYEGTTLSLYVGQTHPSRGTAFQFTNDEQVTQLRDFLSLYLKGRK